MKKILLPLIVLIAGAGVGGGAAYGTAQLTGAPPPGQAAAAAEADDVETSFVPVEKVIAPLVMPEGRLAGYVSFDLQLEVPADEAETVTQRLPLLRHAINLRTYRAPMASGPDGMLPSIEVFRRIAQAAAAEAFGPKVVRRVAVTQAVPA